MINIYFAIEAIENDDERDLVMKLYKQYSKKVSAIAYKILANKEDVEDALGNTFLRIIKYRDKFMDIDDIETNRLIVIITRSVCFDMLDERKKNGFLQAALGYKSDENETNYQEPIADTNVELDYLDKEMIVMIKQQINKLLYFNINFPPLVILIMIKSVFVFDFSSNNVTTYPTFIVNSDTFH